MGDDESVFMFRYLRVNVLVWALTILLGACGGSENRAPPAIGIAVFDSPDPSKQVNGNAGFARTDDGGYGVQVSVSGVAPNKTHEVRFLSGRSCVLPDYLSTTDVDAAVVNTNVIDAWRSSAESRVLAADSSGRAEVQFLVGAPSPASTLWQSTIVAVVGPINPDPGYNGGIQRGHRPQTRSSCTHMVGRPVLALSASRRRLARARIWWHRQVAASEHDEQQHGTSDCQHLTSGGFASWQGPRAPSGVRT